MTSSKFCSKMLLIHFINLVLLAKIAYSRNVPEITSRAGVTEVLENVNISQDTRGNDFLKGDASAIVEQVTILPSITVRKHRNQLNQPKKADSESNGSKIILGIVHNDKQTETPQPVDDQVKSQTIVKYFNQEDYNGLKINPIVVADTYDDSELGKNNRIRNRKEILDLEQEESPIKPDSDKDEKAEHLDTESNSNEGHESTNEEKENVEDEPQSNNSEEDNSDIKSEENESSEEDEETGKIKQDTEGEEIKEDLENEGKNDEENENLKEQNQDQEENQNAKEDDENDSVQDEEEYKEDPSHLENNEQQSNAEEERPNEDDKSESNEQIKETAGGFNNEDNKQENYWNPYVQTDKEKQQTNNNNPDIAYKDNQEAPKEYDENTNIESEQTSENDEPKSNVQTEEKAISNKEDKEGNQDKSAEIIVSDAKKKKKPGKHSSGKGKEKHSQVYRHKGEKGLKAYKGHHEESKGSKGYHDKERHGKKYKDEKGESKKHHEEHGHHGEHHKGEKGEKSYNFAEDGKHSKGHSTNGEHNIHKKDEYNKKEIFYDEHHEGGENEKHGGFDFEDHFEKGGFKKGGHHKKGDHSDHYGKKSLHAKGNVYHEDKGHKKAGGHDEHYNHHSKYGKKKGNSGKKHWHYEKGTGGQGGKKKYSEKYQEPGNTPQHIREPSALHNDNERNHQKYTNVDTNVDTSATDDAVDDTPKIENAELKQEEVENEDSNVDDGESESTEIKIKREKLLDPTTNTNNEKHNIEKSNNSERRNDKFDWSKLETFDEDDDKINTKDQGKILTETSQKQKIYLIIPENNEEKIPTKERDSVTEPSSLQYKSEKITKLLNEPFPAEHRYKLSEIDSIVQDVGENDNKRTNPTYDIRKVIARKPRQFSVA